MVEVDLDAGDGRPPVGDQPSTIASEPRPEAIRGDKARTPAPVVPVGPALQEPAASIEEVGRPGEGGVPEPDLVVDLFTRSEGDTDSLLADRARSAPAEIESEPAGVAPSLLSHLRFPTAEAL